MNNIDDPLQAIGAVILVNIGSFLVNVFNPVLGTLSLLISCGYVSFKLYKEWKDFYTVEEPKEPEEKDKI